MGKHQNENDDSRKEREKMKTDKKGGKDKQKDNSPRSKQKDNSHQSKQKDNSHQSKQKDISLQSKQKDNSQQAKQKDISHQAKQPASQNGSLPANGKSEKEHRKAFPAKKTSSKRNTRQWSYLGIVNVTLFFGVLLATAVCAYIYTEGDLSVEGLNRALPKVQRNSEILLKRAKETLTYENFKLYAENSWEFARPFVIKVKDMLLVGFSIIRKAAVECVRALETVTGDLSPYYGWVEPLWEAFVSCILWLYEVTIDLFLSFNISTMIEGVRWVVGFIIAQAKVLNAEFWKNEHVVSAWKALTPVREVLWAYTETLRNIVGQIANEFYVSWWPVITHGIYKFYIYGRDSLYSLVT